jgi:hypothetical protein
MTTRCLVLGAALLAAVSAPAADAVKPLRVLLVAGGCCHDYATQTRILEQGIERAKDATHWQFSITIKGPATVWIDQLSATGQ